MLGSIIGAGASLLGGVLQRNSDKAAAKKAAKQVLPWNIGGGGYEVSVDPKTRMLTGNMSPEQQAMYDFLGQSGMNLMQTGGPYAGYQSHAQNVGNNQLPSLFNDYLGASGMIPHSAFNQFGGTMGGLQGMAIGGAQQGLNQAFGPGQNAGLSSMLFQQGMGMQDTPVDEYRDIAANQLGLMRDLAAPQEERAQNDMFQKLFSKGQLASSTGGRNFEAFAQGQSNADMQRQLSSQQFAEGLYRGDQQYALNRGAQGQGLLGMGFTGQGQDTARQGMFGQLGSTMMQQGGMFAGQGLDAAVGQSDMVNQRAQQRLAEAQRQMFGGQSMFDANQMSAFNFLNQQNNQQQNLYNMLGLSGNIGSGQASGAAQMGRLVGAENPWAGLISEIGGAVANKI